MKRTSIKRKTGLKRTAWGRNGSVARKMVSKKRQTVRKWYTCIPEGSHGSTTIQKRFWKITSDYVRIRDFYKYKGKCVSCRTVFYSWQEGQACHWKRWTSCNSYMKFYLDNLALGCATCNKFGDQETGYNFTVEMKNRYGENFADTIEAKNKLAHGGKLEDYIILDMMIALLNNFTKLDEMPDYVEKALLNYEKENT
jgi:hypothetical protein